MPPLIQQNNTSHGQEFLMVDEVDGHTKKTGLTPTVTLWKQGASDWINAAGEIVELGKGLYELLFALSDVDTLGKFILHAEAEGANDTDVSCRIVTYDPYLGTAAAAQYAIVAEAGVVAEVRQAAGDLGLYRSHIVPIGMVNGVNKRFQSPLVPLAADAKLYNAATGDQISTGFALDPDTGMLVYSTAPSAASQHYLEGMLYRYRSTQVGIALKQAGLWLYGMWGATAYVVSESGGIVTLAPQPSGLDWPILVIAGARFLLSTRWADAASDAVRLSDAAGQIDTTSRASRLGEVVKALDTQLFILAQDAGYTLPVLPASTDGSLYQGQAWSVERYGDIP